MKMMVEALAWIPHGLIDQHPLKQVRTEDSLTLFLK